jgi:cell wall-associated NlpC family hydrolase
VQNALRSWHVPKHVLIRSIAATALAGALAIPSTATAPAQAAPVAVSVHAPRAAVAASSLAARKAAKRGRVVAYAKQAIGKRYRWGAVGPRAYDCSGLVLASYRAVGIRLPHSSRMQWRYGKRVSVRKLLPGDILFYSRGSGRISHVALYVGGGKMVHASRRGVPVKMVKMRTRGLVGARRIIV